MNTLTKKISLTFFVSTFLMLAVFFLPNITVHAHGYILEGRAKLGAQGLQYVGIVQYEPQSLEAPKGFPQSGPADGQIASAGGLFGGILDEQSSTRWVKTDMHGGLRTVSWYLTAPHRTAKWHYYITKPGWNPDAPLSRDSFELIASFDDNGQMPGQDVSHQVNLPTDRSGYHILLGVWDVADTSNAFYQVVDINLINDGTVPSETENNQDNQSTDNGSDNNTGNGSDNNTGNGSDNNQSTGGGSGCHTPDPSIPSANDPQNTPDTETPETEAPNNDQNCGTSSANPDCGTSSANPDCGTSSTQTPTPETEVTYNPPVQNENSTVLSEQPSSSQSDENSTVLSEQPSSSQSDENSIVLSEQPSSSQSDEETGSEQADPSADAGVERDEEIHPVENPKTGDNSLVMFTFLTVLLVLSSGIVGFVWFKKHRAKNN